MRDPRDLDPMAPLRILHVVPYYEQAWAYGGIPRLATTMTRALARRGHAITVYTTDARDNSSRARVSAGDSGGIDVRMFRNLSNHLAYHWQLFTPVGLGPDLRRALASGGFDIAHVHACYNLPGTMAARILARAGVPYVVSPNGTARPIERRILAKHVFAATAGRGFLPRAARVVAVTSAERAQFVELGLDESRIAVVPNPIRRSRIRRPAGSRPLPRGARTWRPACGPLSRQADPAQRRRSARPRVRHPLRDRRHARRGRQRHGRWRAD